MIIALPTRDGNIDDHFGHCDHYTLMTVGQDGKTIEKTEPMASPIGCGCKSGIAPVLAERGVRIMLAGNIGQGAMNVLNQSGIEVIRGCTGPVEDVAKKYLAGQLIDQLIICNHEDCDHH
jgi:predicted Fe-Mo cluster-binding NifX family protein